MGVEGGAGAGEVEDEAAVEAAAAFGSQALVADDVAAVAEQLEQARGAEVAAAGEAQREAVDEAEAGGEARVGAELEVVGALVVLLAAAGGDGEAAAQDVEADDRLEVEAVAGEVLVELEAEAEVDALAAAVAL